MGKTTKKRNLHSLFLSGALGFLFFLGLAHSSEIHAQTASDQHNHFETERVKPGVAFSRSYRTQAEVDLDWFTSGSVIPPGSPDAGRYDPSLDGAAIPIIYGKTLGQLRKNNGFPGISGDVWIEYEIYIPQAFYDFDFVTWDSMKLFRIWKPKDGCNDEVFMTTTWVGHENDTFWFRGHCGMTNYKPGYQIPGDRWTRLLMHLNMNTKLYEVWAIDVQLDTAKKIFSIVEPGMPNTTINKASPILHSTSRNHSGDQGPAYPDFFVAYRNLLVSTKPIALPSGTPTTPPPSDTTPPAPPSGLNVQ